MVRLAPRLESEAIPPPPEFAGRPRIRCIFYVQERNDPTRPERVRVHSWCLTDLQLMCRLLEKDYSRAIAKQVIPLLVTDINGFKKPQGTKRKLQLLIGLCDIVRSFFNVSSTGVFDEVDEELFQQRLELLLSGFAFY